MIRAELPNGRVLEFPDGTDDAVIDLVVRQELGVAAPVAANDGFDAQFHPAAEMADALVGRGEELLVDPLRRGFNRFQRSMEYAAGDPAGFAEQSRDLEALGDSRRLQELQAATEGEGWLSSALEFAKRPDATLELTLESLAQSIPSLFAGGAAGMAGGAAAGPIGATVGMAAGTGLGSLFTEYANIMSEALAEGGYDLTDQGQVAAAFSDEALLSAARERALQRSIPIAVFDAISGGIAGKFIKPAMEAGERILPAATKEVGAQAVLGGSGEAAGSYAAGDEIKPFDVLAEAFGELVPGAAETLLGVRSQQAAREKQSAEAPQQPADVAPQEQPGDNEDLASKGSAPSTPAPAPRGPVSPISTARGTKVDTQFEVIEADELLTSADEGYDQDLQPRDRKSRASSTQQITEIAARLDPSRLGASSEADRGAPIIGAQDNMVESGNGRVAAIRQAYAAGGEQAEAYRQMVAGESGVDVGGFKAPVLVRRRMTDMTREQRRQFVIEANESSTMSMSDSERANADAQFMDDSVLSQLAPGEINSAANAQFVRAFLARVASSSDTNAFVDPNGNLSQSGLRRIQSAIMARAYGGEESSNSVLQRVTESTDDNVRSITGAMQDVAGQWAQYRSAVSGDTTWDVTDRLVQAVEVVSDMRERGQSVQEWLEQVDAFSERDPVVDELVRLFYNNDLTRYVGRDKIATALRYFIEEAERQGSDTMGLALGGDDVSPGDLLREGKRRAQPETPAPSQPSMFGASGKPSEGADNGGATGQEGGSAGAASPAAGDGQDGGRGRPGDAGEGGQPGGEGKESRGQSAGGSPGQGNEAGSARRPKTKTPLGDELKQRLASELRSGENWKLEIDGYTYVRWDGEYGNAERAESAVNALGTKNILSFRDSDGEDIGAWVTDRPTEFLNIKVPAEPVSSAPDDPDALLTDIEPQDKSQPPRWAHTSAVGRQRGYQRHLVPYRGYPKPNPNGVYRKPEPSLRRTTKKLSLEIFTLEVGPSMWAMTISRSFHTGSMEGASGPLSVLERDPLYATQAEAELRALDELERYLLDVERNGYSSYSAAQKAEAKTALRWVEKEIAKRSQSPESDLPSTPLADTAEKDNRIPKGGLTPSFKAVSFTNRRSIYNQAFADAGYDPAVAASLAPKKQIEILSKLFKETFGVTVQRADGAKYREVIDNLLDGYRNIQTMLHTLGLPAKALSHGGSLKIVMERFSGKYLGAYYPQQRAIAMPGRSNSFAHEWLHSLDHFLFDEMIGQGGDDIYMLTRQIRDKGVEYTPASIQEAWVNLLNAVFFDDKLLDGAIRKLTGQLYGTEDSDIVLNLPGEKGSKTAQNAKRLLNDIRLGRSKLRNPLSDYQKAAGEFAAKVGSDPAYWRDPAEMLARAFESYIANKVSALGRSTEFITKEDWAYLNESELRMRLTFPKAGDRARIFAAFDLLFAHMSHDALLNPDVTVANLPTDEYISQPYRMDERPARNVPGNVVDRGFWRRWGSNIGSIIKPPSETVDDERPFGSWDHFKTNGGYVVVPMGEQLRIIARAHKSKSILEIARKLHTAVGSGDLSLRTLEEEARMHYNNEISRIVNVLDNHGMHNRDDAQNARIIAALRGVESVEGLTKDEAAVALAMREIFDQEWYRASNSGFPLGYTRNGYVQRMLDYDAVWANPEKARPDFEAVYGDLFDERVGELGTDEFNMDLFLQYGKNAKGNRFPMPQELRDLMKQIRRLNSQIRKAEEPTDEQLEQMAEMLEEALPQVRDHFARNAADRWLTRILVGGPTEFDTRGPDAQFTRSRELPPSADYHLKKWLIKDPVEALSSYLMRNSRRVAYAKRFGHDSSKLENLLERAAVNEKVPAQQIRIVRGIVEMASGQRAAKGGWDVIEGAMAPLQALGTLSLLETATFTSLAEPMVAFARTKDFRDIFLPFARMVQDILHQTGKIESDTAAAREVIAQLAGVVVDSKYDMLVTMRMTGDMPLGRRLQPVVTSFFERTLLSPLTRAQRRAMVGTAHKALRVLVKDATEGTGETAAIAKAELRELGISDEPVGVDQDYAQPGSVPLDDFAEWMLRSDSYPTAEELGRLAPATCTSQPCIAWCPPSFRIRRRSTGPTWQACRWCGRTTASWRSSMNTGRTSCLGRSAACSAMRRSPPTWRRSRPHSMAPGRRPPPGAGAGRGCTATRAQRGTSALPLAPSSPDSSW
jgi:hypothetical protein